MAKLSPRERVLQMLKSARTAKPGDDDEDDDDEDGGAPSQDDRVKEAAPTQSAPPGPDDDERTPPPHGGSTPPPAGGTPDDPDDGNPVENEDQNEDDQEEDEGNSQVPPTAQKKMPMKKLGKSLDEMTDEEIQAEVLRRSQETPEFMKSLYNMPEATEILAAIDLSPVVAMIVAKASEEVATRDRQIASLTKSTEAMAKSLGGLALDSEAILLGLAKSMSQQETIIKSMQDQSDDIAIIKSQDNGKVSHGNGQARVPQRSEPADITHPVPASGVGVEVAAPYTGPGKSPLLRGLMKAISAGDITKGEGETLMGLIDGSTGPEGVWKKMQDKGIDSHVSL